MNFASKAGDPYGYITFVSAHFRMYQNRSISRVFEICRSWSFIDIRANPAHYVGTDEGTELPGIEPRC